jgi:hypothetical protein
VDVVVGAVVVAEGKGGSEDGNEGSGGSGGSGGKCGNDAILLDKRGGEEKRENKYKLSKIEDSRRSSGSNIGTFWPICDFGNLKFTLIKLLLYIDSLIKAYQVLIIIRIALLNLFSVLSSCRPRVCGVNGDCQHASTSRPQDLKLEWKIGLQDILSLDPLNLKT